jgi:glyoxylase I family protein
MRIEHIGYMMREPVKAAEWYVKNLGFVVMREGKPPANARFLADSSKKAMVEIYNNPKAKVPDYASMDPLILHLAVSTDDVEGMRKKLLAAGATPCEDTYTTDTGDTIAVVRDPWGFPVQLVKRARPML